MSICRLVACIANGSRCFLLTVNEPPTLTLARSLLLIFFSVMRKRKIPFDDLNFETKFFRPDLCCFMRLHSTSCISSKSHKEALSLLESNTMCIVIFAMYWSSLVILQISVAMDSPPTFPCPILHSNWLHRLRIVKQFRRIIDCF